MEMKSSTYIIYYGTSLCSGFSYNYIIGTCDIPSPFVTYWSMYTMLQGIVSTFYFTHFTKIVKKMLLQFIVPHLVLPEKKEKKK